MSGASVDRGTILLDLEGHERGVLASLARATTRALLDPASMARARMLPDAYRDDPDAAAEYARYTRDDLRRRKLDSIRRLTADLGDETDGRTLRLPLDLEGADEWARTLTDLRLTMAIELEIDEDGGPPVAPEAREVYDWLGHLQWMLVESLDRVERKGRDGRRYRS